MILYWWLSQPIWGHLTPLGDGLPISAGKELYTRTEKWGGSGGKKGRIRPCQYGIMSGAWREAVPLLSEV